MLEHRCLQAMDESLQLKTLLEQWFKYDEDPSSRAEMASLWDEKKFDELEKRLRNRIAFGTAGLRGRMAPGFSCMNEVTVMQASQGLAKWFKTKHGDICSQGVVIGHDARHNSTRFAALATNAFLALDIPVYFFTELSATPLVSYSIKHYKAAGGVMVTASHNPALDNGYKVYFQRSAQINSPMDQEISESIEKNLDPWSSAWKHPRADEEGKNGTLRTTSYEPAVQAYLESICQFALSTVDHLEKPRPFVYTPLHGVGGLFLPRIMKMLEIGDQMISVSQQFNPDPDFPTVNFPNPEEAGALDLAMELGDKQGRDIIIANDPDADRFAAAQKINGNNWFTFTGNQLGVLLASHLFERRAELQQSGRCIVLASTVSTGMLSKMASAHGIKFEETLTGFKWMGNRAFELAAEGWEVPFAFEEALGYMFPNICNDKDGLTAAAVFMIAEGKWRSQGITPYEKLQQLYHSHGYHETLNTYFRSPNPAATADLFTKIRGSNYGKGKKIGGFEILRWRDMTEGYDSDTADNKPVLPVDKASHMLTLWLDRGVTFTLRGSGTEPKVKLYIESCQSSQSGAISAVCDAYEAVKGAWIDQFGGEMESLPHIVTSSGHIYKR